MSAVLDVGFMACDAPSIGCIESEENDDDEVAAREKWGDVHDES